MSDTIFKNCTTLDLNTGAEKQSDVLISEGRITSVSDSGSAAAEGAVPVDCTGMYLFPGFIDFHVHLFEHGSTFGLDADRLLTAGVTSAVDMGSAGWINYPAFHMCDMEGKRIRAKAFINVSPVGQPGKGISEPLTDSVISREKIAESIQKWPGEIIGIKVRISRNIVGELGLRPLEKAVEIAEGLGLPVCVHTTNPPSSTADIVKILRPGDIYSHTYHGDGLSILGEDGHVLPEILEAQERGILFEVGNGLRNFDFRTAEPVIRDGLKPALITSDSTPTTFHKNICMWDLPFVMSKFVCMGVPLADVIRSVTETPAAYMRTAEKLGTLEAGCPADLTLCRITDEETVFADSAGNRRTGHFLIKPVMTVLNGETVFSDL